MKFKTLFRAIAVVAVIFTMVGGAQTAYAAPSFQEGDPQVVIRDLTYWDAIYTGYVDGTRFEKWPVVFDADYYFSVTATPTSGDLVPMVLLLDADGNELVSGSGSIISEQLAGNYFIQVQPESGAGFYELTISQEEEVVETTSAAVEVAAESIDIGETTEVTVSLSEVPAEGYASAEFACTYPVDLVSVSNIAVTELFGTDPVSAVSDPQDGTFIVAVAGSNGQRAMAAGSAFSFTVTGVAYGDVTVDCAVRASVGDNQLVDLTSTPAMFSVAEVVVVEEGTLAGQAVAVKPVTINLYDADATLVATLQAEADGTFSVVAPVGLYTVVAEAAGYLNAEGAAELLANETLTKATVELVAGDIDGNGVIDQFDALTIGMNYNGSMPEEADLNADGLINVLDLEVLAANYHAEGPSLWE